MHVVRGLPSEHGRPILDATHQGPVLLIFIPTFLCPAGLLVIATIYVRRHTGVTFSWVWTNPVLWDFLGLAVMLALAVAWSAVVCAQLQVGLGTVEPSPNFSLFQKYEYTAELLYLLAIMSWKCTNGLSTAQIFGRADERKRLFSTVSTMVITTAFLAALFAAAFQCDGPDHWAIRDQSGQRCLSRPAFWSAVGAIDILSDVVIHGLLAITVLRSQMISAQKKSATTIVSLYLATYVTTAAARWTYVLQSWNRPAFALPAAYAALATFSQLVFPMSMLCIGKLSKYLDLESYLSSTIGASSRKLASHSGKNYHVPQYYGRSTANATGPERSHRSQKSHSNMYGDSIEELPLRTVSKSGENPDVDHGNEDAITVKRDVTVQHERGTV